MSAEDIRTATHEINFRVIRNVRLLQNLLHVFTRPGVLQQGCVRVRGMSPQPALVPVLVHGRADGAAETERVHESVTRANNEWHEEKEGLTGRRWRTPASATEPR